MSANTLGRYQIIREIARSNDVVYEAVDASINRRVALKELLLPPNLAGAQKRERVERFYREARAAGSLAHPNIVTIYEAGEDHGRHFIAMELLEGQTLRNVLDIEGKLSVERALEIANEVCDALNYAHAKGVIHRDIKPDNIQILPSGHIKLTDFGIARIMEEPSITADGQVFGTPSYMSPEQVAGKPLDCRTDIFSLGIVFYEMLTGRKPFTGDTVVTITYNIMNQDATIPTSVPSYLDRVLRRSLAKDPGLRYRSASEMAADLGPNSLRNSLTAPDPSTATVSMPGQIPQYPPPTYQPPSTPHLPDPFAHMKPGDLSLPRIPGKPLLSPDAKYFLKVLFLVLLACAAVIGFIWVLSAGYQGWQKQGREQEVVMHLDAGKKYFDSQSYQAAIEEWTMALKFSSDPEISKTARRNIAITYIQLGKAAEGGGNPFQAIAYYRQAVSSDAMFPDAYFYLGSALDQIHHEDEALGEYDKAIQYGGGGEFGMAARQNAAVIFHRRGDQALQQGQTDVAIQWWRKALEIAPGTQAGSMAQDKLSRYGG